MLLQPIDMVKVSIQSGVKGGPFAVAANIIKTDGLRAMYTVGVIMQHGACHIVSHVHNMNVI